MFSCAEEVIEKPKNLIPKDEMVQILYDLCLINSATHTNPSILEQHHIEAMPYIYKKYGIDSAQFVNSDTYYASKPLEYETIYKEVAEIFEREKEALESKRRKLNDSIRTKADKRKVKASKKDSLD